ncbi:hypothetical protein ACFYQT_39075 [Streptomyces tibetensis]|jgi:hypothetical protein|uniref:Uncharacterized protein n=1 Tax=Streptomyces tibetensis TaxID=2382123 RepID=A0ABW6N7Z1_9ACTN|nr:hypothetical protein [Streptomyces tibetensis]
MAFMALTFRARRAARKPDDLNEPAETSPAAAREEPSAYRGSDHVSVPLWTTYRPVGIMSRELFTCP